MSRAHLPPLAKRRERLACVGFRAHRFNHARYDSLNRLSGASGSGDANGAWSQTFTFDGFGNLVAKAGNNAPNNLSINVNPATNQLTGNNALYDSVGNLLQYGVGTPEQYYTYDIENRVMQVTANSATTAYGYDTRNQRIYSGPQTVGCGSTELYFFYGVDGKKLDVITAEHSTSGSCGVTVAPVTQTNVWFRGRLLVPQDRLNSHGKYFPYGEDRTNPNPANPANGVEKFATYTRDAESGLDYAYQRYYTSGLGRFLTADRKSSSAKLPFPQTWNRYSYVLNDPMNLVDPRGTEADGCTPDAGLHAPSRSSAGVRFVNASFMRSTASFEEDEGSCTASGTEGGSPGEGDSGDAGGGGSGSSGTGLAGLNDQDLANIANILASAVPDSTITANEGTWVTTTPATTDTSQGQAVVTSTIHFLAPDDPSDVAPDDPSIIDTVASNTAGAPAFLTAFGLLSLTGGAWANLPALYAAGNELLFGTTAGRIFYTGGLAAAIEASRFAGRTGSVLSQTPTGKLLGRLDPYLPGKVMTPAWDFASRFYASGATGSVTAGIGGEINSNAIFFRTELPILLNQGLTINPFDPVKPF